MEKVYFLGAEINNGLVAFLKSGFTAEFGYFQPTYDDPECKQLECHSAKRSFYDICKIVETYFPHQYTKNEIAKALWNEVIVVVTYCPDINKCVFKKRQLTTSELSDWDIHRSTSDGFNFHEFKRLLYTNKTIYFRNPVINGSLKDFLNSGFSNYVNDKFCNFRDTYSDPNFKIQECHPARRSFYDICDIVNTQFPGRYSKSDIAKCLVTLPGIFCFYCSDIQKYVFMIDYECAEEGIVRESSKNSTNKRPADNFYYHQFEELLNS